MTRQGKVPHLDWNGIELPVALDVNVDSRYMAEMYQSPQVANGKLVYALPGGGRYVPE